MRVLRVDIASGAISDAFDAQAVLSPWVDDLAGVHFAPRSRTLLLVSQESKKVLQVTTDGELIGQPLVIGGTQPEGIVLAEDEQTLYVISEPNELLAYHR